MDYNQFKAAAMAAARPQALALRQPVLISMREEQYMSVLIAPGRFLTTEYYAATLGSWPETGPVYHDSPRVAIALLVEQALEMMDQDKVAAYEADPERFDEARLEAYEQAA